MLKSCDIYREPDTTRIVTTGRQVDEKIEKLRSQIAKHQSATQQSEANIDFLEACLVLNKSIASGKATLEETLSLQNIVKAKLDSLGYSLWYHKIYYERKTIPDSYLVDVTYNINTFCSRTRDINSDIAAERRKAHASPQELDRMGISAWRHESIKRASEKKLDFLQSCFELGMELTNTIKSEQVSPEYMSFLHNTVKAKLDKLPKDLLPYEIYHKKRIDDPKMVAISYGIHEFCSHAGNINSSIQAEKNKIKDRAQKIADDTNELKETLQMREDIRATNDKVEVIVPGAALRTKESLIRAEGLINLPSGYTRNPRLTDDVKSFLADSLNTSTHLLQDNENSNSSEITVILKDMALNSCSQQQLPYTQGAIVSYDGATPLRPEEIDNKLKKLKGKIINKGRNNNVYMLVSRNFLKENIAVKAHLLTEAFRYISEHNEELVTTYANERRCLSADNSASKRFDISRKDIEKAIQATHTYHSNKFDNSVGKLNNHKRVNLSNPFQENYIPLPAVQNGKDWGAKLI